MSIYAFNYHNNLVYLKYTNDENVLDAILERPDVVFAVIFHDETEELKVIRVLF